MEASHGKVHMELCLERQMRYGHVKMRENENISKKVGTRGSIQGSVFPDYNLLDTQQIEPSNSLSTWCSLHYTLSNMNKFELGGKKRTTIMHFAKEKSR